MKKLTIIAIAAAALALAACTQEKSIVPADSGMTEITATHLSTRSALETTYSLGSDDPNYAILWDAPDKILVGYPGAVAEFTSTNTEPSEEATFTGKLPEGRGDLYGIYPAASGNTVNSDGTFSIAFKAEQDAVAGSYDKEAFPAVAVSESKNLSFQNVCSLLALTVGDEGVTMITLKGNGGACFYGGTFTVSADGSEPEIDDFTEDVYEITLTADGTFDTSKTYYMSVPPITFEDGVIFTLTYEDGNTTDVVLAKSVTAERNKVHIVPTLQGDPYNGHEYVDLGLPSGLKWATCNVGATKPEECGDYFAWADTEPYYESISDDGTVTWKEGKEEYAYDWPSYLWVDHTINDLNGITKYTLDDGQTECIWYEYTIYNKAVEGGFYGTLEDFIDNLSKEDSDEAKALMMDRYGYDGSWDGFITQAQTPSFVGDGVSDLGDPKYNYEDDAARKNWGGTWRIPSPADFQELINNTDNEWTDNYNETGMVGYIFTSKSDAAKFIFLPAAGFWLRSIPESIGECGNYWCSSLYKTASEAASDSAREVYFFPGSIRMSRDGRNYGFSVRPVSE